MICKVENDAKAKVESKVKGEVKVEMKIKNKSEERWLIYSPNIYPWFCNTLKDGCSGRYNYFFINVNIIG